MGAPDPRDAFEPQAEGKPRAAIATSRRPASPGPSSRPKAVKPPTVKDASWPKTDIDRFLLAALEANGLRPVADADRRALIRRATLRPDRPAADARGSRGVRRRRVARGLREGRRPAPGLAAVRRALGPALARRGPLRRVERQGQHDLSPTPGAIATGSSPRSTPTSPTTSSSRSRSPATSSRPRTARQRAEHLIAHRLPGRRLARPTTPRTASSSWSTWPTSRSTSPARRSSA